MRFFEEMVAHAAKEAPREMCGLIIEENNEEKWIPCENKSPFENQFEIDPKVLSKYQLISKIKYIVHSHYNQDCRPSKVDKIQCREVGIPYLIVSYPDKQYEIYQP